MKDGSTESEAIESRNDYNGQAVSANGAASNGHAARSARVKATPVTLDLPARPVLEDPHVSPHGEGATEFDFSASNSTIQLSSLSLSASHQQLHTRRSQMRTLLLVLYDFTLLNIAFFLAYDVRFVLLRGVTLDGAPFTQPDFGSLRIFQMASVVTMLALLALRGLYRLRATGAPFHRASIIFTSATIFFAVFTIYAFFFHATQPALVENTRALVVFTWLSAIAVLFAGRVLLATIIALGYRLGIGRTRVVVVGSGRLGKLVMQHLAAATSLGYQVIGFIHGDSDTKGDFGRFRALGDASDLEWAIRGQRINEVVIALSSSSYQITNETISVCERNGLPFRIIPDLHELSLTRVDLIPIEGIPSLSVHRASADGWQRQVKRAIDIAGASLGLVVGLPIWLLLALIIRIDSSGPAIYSQERIGLRGKPFTSHKFRSMMVGADAHKADLTAENRAGRGLFKLKNDPRCTRVGRWIRRTSLDEIPQLWNVLRGDMSLVGPRPPLAEEYARYEEWEKRRLEMLPGLTGLWQVRGRSTITFDEMVLMDLYYIENWSLRLDVQILIKTISVVLFSYGAY